MARINGPYFASDASAGAYLDFAIGDYDTYMYADWDGGWHSDYSFNVSGIYCSLGYDEGGGEISVKNGSNYAISGIPAGGYKEFINNADHSFMKRHTPYTAKIYAYLRCTINGYQRESQAEYSFTVPALASYQVTYNANGGSVTPAPQTKWQGENLTLSAAVARTGFTFTGWNTKPDGTGTRYSAGATYTANAQITLYAQWTTIVPTALEILSHAFENGVMTFTLQRGSNYETAAKALRVYRGIDSYEQLVLIDTIDKAATSYTDYASPYDHVAVYKFVYLAYDDVTESIGDTVGFYTDPLPPSSISLARSSTSASDIIVTLVNNSTVSDRIEWQSSPDGVTWPAVATVVTGSPVTSFTATGLSGVVYIRVRNIKSGNTPSDWLVSEQISIRSKPNPPTIIYPTSGTVHDYESDSMLINLQHNSTDGSAMTQAKIKVKNLRTSTTKTLTSTGDYKLLRLSFSNLPSFVVGDEFELSLATRGADPEFSDFSDSVNFFLRSSPQIHFELPYGSVTSMPIQMVANYTDMQGFTIADATVSLKKDGNTLFSEKGEIGSSSITAELDISEFLPVNGETYQVVVDATSSSSLSTSVSHSFTAQFTPPNTCSLNLSNDRDTGYCSMLITEDSQTGTRAQYVSVARVNPDGTRVMLVDRVAVGTSFVDKYAPLNVPYYYEVISFSNVDAIATKIVDNVLRTNRWFAYFDGGIAWGNVSAEEGKISLSSPEMVFVQHVGQDYPNVYNTLARSETHNPSFKILTREQAERFRALSARGIGVYKSAHGYVFNAAFREVGITPYTNNAAYFGDVAISVTRISGEAL